MSSPLMQLAVRWLVLALGVVLAARLVPGIRCDDGTALLAIVVLLSLFNAVLKPLLVIFTLPFIFLTMGVGVVVINALLFLWAGRLVDGFHVAGFRSALGGSIVVSLTNLGLGWIARRRPADRGPGPRPPRRGRDDDAIDI